MLSFRFGHSEEPSMGQNFHHLRIAIPSWGWHTSFLRPRRQEPALSREELLEIFGSDLNASGLFEARQAARMPRRSGK